MIYHGSFIKNFIKKKNEKIQHKYFSYDYACCFLFFSFTSLEKRATWAKKKSLFAVTRPILKKTLPTFIFLFKLEQKYKKSADQRIIFHYFLHFFGGKTNEIFHLHRFWILAQSCVLSEE